MKIWLSLMGALLLYSLCGCNTKPQNPSEVRERAADATAELKRDTKALAEGIQEGWKRDKSVDINTAKLEELESLPGVTPKRAEEIVAHRPYAKNSELVEKHVLSKAEYDRIADRLTGGR
jgi:DNA uptake protein ComE-like DNA-binding protein